MSFIGSWNFWLGVIAGALVMFLLGFLPVIIGPLIGGIAAGFIARGDAWTGAKAGFAAGVLWILMVVAGLLVFPGTSPGGMLLPGTFAGLLVQPLMLLLLFYNGFIWGVLGAIGGTVGGILAGKGV